MTKLPITNITVWQRDHRSRDVIGFTTACVIIAYHL